MAFVSEAMPRSYLPSQMLVHFNGHNFTIPHIHESQNLKSILEETFKNSQKNSRDLCGVNIQVKNIFRAIII